MREVVVVDVVRSPIGKRGGGLSSVHSNELLGAVLKELLARNGLTGGEVEHVLGGCVNQVGMQASNVIRNAWLTAGLPLEVPAATVSAQCGSSQEAFTLTHALVASGQIDVAVACGVESMSHVAINAATPADGPGFPREGRYAELYEPTSQMEAADRIAEKWNVSREALDAFAKRSQDRAIQAWKENRFDTQVVSIDVPSSDGTTNSELRTISRDEGMRESTLEGLSGLRPNLSDRKAPGLHTAGSSSQISDGASAALIMTRVRASELGLTPRARIVDSILIGSDPVLMLTGPIPATLEMVRRTGIELSEIDLFEVNEAFASIVCSWAKELTIDMDRVNVNGGAIALGHPLGATGTMLIAKVLCELERTETRYGLVTMCCGGGLGTGTLIERAA